MASLGAKRAEPAEARLAMRFLARESLEAAAAELRVSIDTARNQLKSIVFSDGIGNSPPGAVPEPSTWAMMLLGFAGLGWAGWRSRRLRVLAAETPV
jgi:hypothetical protein